MTSNRMPHYRCGDCNDEFCMHPTRDLRIDPREEGGDLVCLVCWEDQLHPSCQWEELEPFASVEDRLRGLLEEVDRVLPKKLHVVGTPVVRFPRELHVRIRQALHREEGE